MKAIKKAIYGSVILSAASIFALGSLNSFNLVDKTSFLKNDLNIKFAKRLDDLTGHVVIGRMAASIPSWKPTISTKLPKIDSLKSRVSAIKKEKNKEVVAKVDTKELTPPAIVDAPDLELTGGLYNKTALDKTKKYKGSASIVDGVIESIDVTFPDGKKLILNTRDRMVGNVFEYEDAQTRMRKSGLIYKMSEGHYMVNLTDDSEFSTVRLEFKTKEGSDLKTDPYDDEDNWAMNDQNSEKEDKNEVINDDEDSFQEENFAKNEQAEDEREDKNIVDEDEFIEDELVETSPEVKVSTYAFKFALN